MDFSLTHARIVYLPQIRLSNYLFYGAGEYWVVGVDIEQYDEKRAHKYLRGLWQKETDLSIVNAYRSYFSIVASAPINFMNFTRNVNEYRQKPPFNFTNPLANVGGIVQVTTRDDENFVVTFRSSEFKELLNSYDTKLGLQFRTFSYLCDTLRSFLESFTLFPN